MALNRQNSQHARLVRLIRRIAREEAWYVIDEHVEEYEHHEKPVDDFEAKLEEEKPLGE